MGLGVGSFLSRLCGGEFVVSDHDITVVFLSRLCGGEFYSGFFACELVFLSRLCGGEWNANHGLIKV